MKNYFIGLCFLCLTTCIIFSCTSDDSSEESSVELPTVSTAETSLINQNTATSGGNVTNDGGGAIAARGVAFATTPNPTTANDKTIDAGTTGVYSSALTNLTASTQYYVRAYATNSAGTAYGNQQTFTTTAVQIALPIVTTTAVSAITQTSASVGGNVTAAGGAAISERGICWAITQNPTTVNSKVTASGTTGAFTGAISGLNANSTYYARAYATNSGGTAYGAEVTFITLATTTAGPSGGNAICDGSRPTAVVNITSSTGKVWMDRNLGASRAATSATDFQAYGCMYQWGRGNDGHASIVWERPLEDDGWGNNAGTPVNGTTYTLSTTDTPPNALFIADQTSQPYDWRSPKNDNLWQGANGINNPCPAGYRVPTRAEFRAELTAYSITGTTSAYNSVHKFPLAGDRAFDSGRVRGQGADMFFWTSTTDFNDAYNVLIQPGAVYSSTSNGRAGGYSVRCIKN